MIAINGKKNVKLSDYSETYCKIYVDCQCLLKYAKGENDCFSFWCLGCEKKSHLNSAN